MSKADSTLSNGAAAPSVPERVDGWINATLGFGSLDRDKTRQLRFSRDVTGYGLQRELWRGDDIIARIVERVPEEMLRQGYSVTTGDSSLDDDLRGWLEDIGIDEHLRKALEYQRAYGGGAVVLGADDGQDLSMPLMVARVRSMGWAHSFDSSEIWARLWDNDPKSRGFNSPLIYEASLIHGGHLRVHRSRVLAFPGVYVSNHHRRERNGWGDGVIDRVADPVAQYQQAWQSARALLSDFSQGVFKLEGLQEAIASDRDDLVQARMKAIDLQRSVLRSVLLDSREDFRRETAPLAGISELLREYATRVGIAADMPLTLLFGMSPAGLSATGESDIRGFYDRIRCEQETELRPALERVVAIGLSILTSGSYDGDYRIEFESLWQPTAMEAQDLRLKQAQQDQIYLAEGVVTPAEVAASRFGGDAYSHETEVDLSTRRRVLSAQQSPLTTRPAPAAPSLPAPVKAPAAAPVDLSATALNGAQVTAALEIVQQVASRALPRGAGLGMLQAFFNLDRERAESIMGEVGLTFFAVESPSTATETAPSLPPSPVDAPESNGTP